MEDQSIVRENQLRLHRGMVDMIYHVLEAERILKTIYTDFEGDPEVKRTLKEKTSEARTYMSNFAEDGQPGKELSDYILSLDEEDKYDEAE